jgi:formylglycine-generating enzyme required for sulfatase activity
MVEVPAPQGGWFCIDSTEVTNSDYAAFVSSHPDANGQKPECAWNTTYEPAIGWPATGNLPVVEVDWCDAAAYCAWAGKRLCGRIGGGPNAFGDYAVAAKSQWYDACSMAGKRAYPYGDAYRASTCNGYERGAGGPLPVGQMPSCQGGYDGIFDLSGNVDEWEDSCNGTSGASDSCQFRGGSYNDSEPTYRLECDWAANSTDWFGTRESHGGNLGFRCCAG